MLTWRLIFLTKINHVLHKTYGEYFFNIHFSYRTRTLVPTATTHFGIICRYIINLKFKMLNHVTFDVTGKEVLIQLFSKKKRERSALRHMQQLQCLYAGCYSSGMRYLRYSVEMIMLSPREQPLLIPPEISKHNCCCCWLCLGNLIPEEICNVYTHIRDLLPNSDLFGRNQIVIYL